MKPYKLFDTWLDLDHVLAVTDLPEPRAFEDGSRYLHAKFTITLAFLYMPVCIERHPNTDEEITAFCEQYKEFLHAWKNKDGPLAEQVAIQETKPDYTMIWVPHEGEEVNVRYNDRWLQRDETTRAVYTRGQWLVNGKVRGITRETIMCWWRDGNQVFFS